MTCINYIWTHYKLKKAIYIEVDLDFVNYKLLRSVIQGRGVLA